MRRCVRTPEVQVILQSRPGRLSGSQPPRMRSFNAVRAGQTSDCAQLVDVERLRPTARLVVQRDIIFKCNQQRSFEFARRRSGINPPSVDNIMLE